MDEDRKREASALYVNLKEHFDMLLTEREKQMNLRFEASATALAASKEELERRLEILNELRSAVERDRSQFVREDVYEEKTKGYDTWCRGVDKKFAYWGGGLTVLVFILEFLFRYIQR
jgi:hypothetical protein